MTYQVINGNNIEVLKTFEPHHISGKSAKNKSRRDT
jgi:hypothetical protein